MKKIEHIGIAVKDIKESNMLFAKLLNRERYKSKEVESESIITSFFKIVVVASLFSFTLFIRE
jgi:methylmalonyl-CoA/ethylmalonyl-CoA epimerase